MAVSAAGTPAATASIETETMRRVGRRLIPLLILCYFAAYLDRVNVGFAALRMNQDLGFTAEIFGIGSGIFFLGYFLAEIPSNLILSKVGARRWIGRILLTWGVISAATAFVTGTWSFLGIRFLLGVAEAGFYPGIILYLTWWFPSSYRSRFIGLFMTAIPISIVCGSLISSQILRLGSWGGLADWQWLFILEAIPAIVLGIVVFVFLTDRPEQAHWLTQEQKDWLVRRLAAERTQRESIHDYSLAQTMRNPRVWLLTLVYFGQNVAGYGLVLFLPQIISRFGVGVGVNGLLSAAVRLCRGGHGAVGHALRPHGGAQPARGRCMFPEFRRPGRLHVPAESGADDGGDHPVADGPGLDRADILDAADGDAVRHRRGRRHRADQRRRQSRRLPGAVHDGRDQGRDRQLQHRAAVDRNGRPGVRRHPGDARP
jgi:MFS family permease